VLLLKNNYMKNIFILVLMILGASLSGQSIFDKAKGVLSGNSSINQEDAGLGLKEALNLGVEEAVNQLSAEGGYLESVYKIELPEEAKGISKKLKVVPGFDDWEKKLILKMNEAAELAVKEATPIFVGAIKEMTFDDALQILKGEDDAATRYLESKSLDQLYAAFMPIIQKSLDAVNAREVWTSAVTAYNKIPFTKNTNPNLDDHVNKKALVGIFGLIETKEEGIRNNVDQRTTKILKKVFGS
jgi:hypothetical protein